MDYILPIILIALGIYCIAITVSSTIGDKDTGFVYSGGYFIVSTAIVMLVYRNSQRPLVIHFNSGEINFENFERTMSEFQTVLNENRHNIAEITSKAELTLAGLDETILISRSNNQDIKALASETADTMKKLSIFVAEFDKTNEKLNSCLQKLETYTSRLGNLGRD